MFFLEQGEGMKPGKILLLPAQIVIIVKETELLKKQT
jgi:hypothetical protein